MKDSQSELFGISRKERRHDAGAGWWIIGSILAVVALTIGLLVVYG